MISILLMRKIAQLFLILFLGYFVVKIGLVKSQDSMVLSKLCLYLIMPCAVFNAFQVDCTEEIRTGLFLAVGVSVVMHVVLVLIGAFCGRVFHMDAVEEASVIYSNAANLIIPIVSSVLGKEWVIYTSAFVGAQALFVWSHGIHLFSGEKKIHWKKMILNTNMLAIFAGAILFLTGIRLPSILGETVDSLGQMVGPISMLIMGMLFAAVDLKQVLHKKRIYLVVLFRMILCPAILLFLLLVSGVEHWIDGGKQVLLVTYLASITPTAAMVTQFTQLHKLDAMYASAINILTTLVCVLTMPAFVALYELF